MLRKTVREFCLIGSEVPKGMSTDNISYYECDVSDWEKVKKVADVVIQEVWLYRYLVVHVLTFSRSDNPLFL